MNPGPRHASELFDCERVNNYLESYLLGQIPPPERRGMRLHIHRCADCFEKVTRRDPLQLFAPLADEERAPEAWAGFDEKIFAAIRQEAGAAGARAASRRRFLPFGLTPARAAASLVALAAVVALVLVLPRLAPDRPAIAPPAVAEAPPAAVAAGAPLLQTVEQVRTDDSRPVQVYTMAWAQRGPAPSAAQAEPPVTELVLIVDAGLDL